MITFNIYWNLKCQYYGVLLFNKNNLSIELRHVANMYVMRGAAVIDLIYAPLALAPTSRYRPLTHLLSFVQWHTVLVCLVYLQNKT